ncbi:MAG: bifunctional shikimate kinase/3-dehydroquinate synthase [Polyangiaceae bacterium]|nr:bifunctional shikimate kinase/3-dehydroquinate synthase [Polyangiaceae bacterium]
MTLARPLALAGMMASGKSTVGQVVAARVGVPFEDLDTLVERAAGRSVAELFSRVGEAGFRALERQVLAASLADRRPRVIALGGGALLDRGLRLDALRAWTVVSLAVPAAEVVRRAAGSPRPLLQGPDPLAAVERLAAGRAEAYAECHLTVDASRPVEEVADDLVARAPRAPLVVALGTRTYPVALGAAAPALSAHLHALAPTKTLALTDSNVERLLSSELRDTAGGMFHVTPPGEAAKTVASLHAAWARAAEVELDRRGAVVGVGGGAVTDLAGFLAGTWMRGVRWVAVPTTLLGMVDAAVGGKTAVDLGSVKNVVGVFHQPRAVILDPSFCATESPRAFASGLAEVVKSALVGDAALLDELERSAEALDPREPGVLGQVVRAAVAVKCDVVSRDEREGGLRAVLNLGHTVGHALEAEGGLERWTHGEAVALGTVIALRVGERLGVTPVGLAARIRALFVRLRLPVDVDRDELRAATAWLGRDKKRAGRDVQYVLVDRPGSAVVTPLPLEELARLVLA